MRELPVPLKNNIRVVNGSSLIELLMYIALLLFLFSLCFFWVIHIYMPMIKNSKQSNTMTTFFSGSTKLCFDMYQAPSHISMWKKKDAAVLIWPHGTIDIGWRHDKGALMRTEGTYTVTTQTWHAAKTGLAMPAIADFVCNLHEKQRSMWVVEITYTLDNGDMFTDIITLRNRNIS